jgi:spore germination protein KB
MRRADTISARQLAALGFVFILSSLIRNVPGRTASLAGAGAWAAVLPAAAVLLLLPVFYRRALGKSAGRSLGLVLLDCAGPVLGRAVLAALLGWFVFAAGFLLRSGADRFMTTVYPSSGPAVFIVTMLIACVPAVMGQLKTLARAAMIFRFLLLLVLALVFVCSLPKVKLAGLWQLPPGAEKGVLHGALTVINPICTCVYLLFFADRTEGGVSRRTLFVWLAVVLGIAEMLIIVTLGVLGADMTVKIHNPFFAVARDMTIFGSLEHMEAVIVSVWVFSDFVIVSVMLRLASLSLRLILALGPEPEDARCFDLSRGRWTGLLCPALALVAALCLAPESIDLRFFGESLVPAINLGLSFVLIPAVLLIGRLRRRL